jgi:outer membrane murein-binding lipoprotein Lpp
MTPMLGSKLRRDVRCNPVPMRLRPLLLLLAVVLSLGLLAGCGGDGNTESKGEEADSSTDVDQLLKDTFTGKKDIKSGKLDVALDADSGGQTFVVKLGGAFESTGTGKMPKLDMDASFEGGGQTLEGGLTLTGDKGFVSYAGTDYEIDGATFQAIKAGYEEQAKAGGSQSDQSLATLGIDPSKWLTNARNEGEAKVGDTDTVKITGDVDVPKMLDDVNAALAKIRTLGGSSAAGLPDQLSEQDKKQAADAIKDLSVEIYTGSEDKILRRIVVAMKLEVPAATGTAQSANVKLDVQLLDLNESQEFKAPENPKPFKDLAAQLQQLGLGGLGGLGGAGGGSGSGSGSSGGTTQENLEKYSQCIEGASGNDEIRKCADLLTP